MMLAHQNDDVIASSLRDAGLYPMWARQGVGMIRDVPPAADRLATLVRESQEALASLRARVQAS